MKLRKLALAPIAAAVMALSVVGPAAAATESYSFGDLLSGQSGPDDGSIWGTLSVTTGLNNSYAFTLGLNSNFSTLFGSGAYVSEAVFSTASGMDPISTSIESGSWGVTGVKLKKNAPLANLGFDFGDCLGSGSDCSHGGDSGRLQAGESVSWTTTFSVSQGDPLNFGIPPAGLHVQAFGSNLENSAWYGPANPIPEPETYAMLLAGLGLLGFAARRRKQREAA